SLEAPQLLSPTDGARGIPLNGKLIWKKVQIANAYKLQLSSDENFTTNIVNLPNWADTSSTYPALQYGKRYFWHTATIKSPDVSNWSLTNSFYTLLQAPILVYPANNATGVANSDTLKWNKVIGTDTYYLQISTSPVFSSTVVNDSTVYDSLFVFSNLSSNTKHYWRTKCKNLDGDTSAWSETRNYTTLYGPPTLLSPPNNSSCAPNSGTLSWSAVIGASNYQLQVSRNQTFSTTIIDQPIITSTFYTYTGLGGNDTLFWKVIAKGPGNTSNSSSVFKFRLVPPVPQRIYPENNVQYVPTSCTISWTGLSQAIIYHLKIADNAGFANPVINDSSISTLSLAVNNLKSSTKYYWQIRSGRNGCYGDWSSSWEFTTQLGVPVLKSPANNSLWADIAGKLQWDSVKMATNYKIQISDDPTFNIIKATASNLTKTEYDYSSLDNNTKYYWQVQGSNVTVTGDWSNIWSFTTKIKTPELIFPANNSENVPRTDTLRWNKVDGADSYNLQISNDNSFANLIKDTTGIPDTLYVLSGLGLNTEYFWHVNAVKTNTGITDWSLNRKFKTSNADGVNEHVSETKELSLEIYPNPVNEIANIVFTLKNSGEIYLEVYNQLGVKVRNLYHGNLISGTHNAEFNTSSLANGIYYCKLVSGMNSIVNRIVILK
ncbi:MAG: T9SS type A sorting domain-containing protein, partial [Bacteroidota bacterium]